MLPHVGSACKYTLATKFAALNGVYNTLGITTFEAALQDGVDFVSSLYTPAGLQQTDYVNDYNSYKGTDIVQVSPVTDSSVIYYFPEGILSLVPDPTVQCYPQMVLSIVIGPFQDTNVYSWIKSEVEDIVCSVTGNTNTARFHARPELSVYLTQAEYDTLQEQRAANIKSVQPLMAQILDQSATINSLQSQIAALQQKLIDVSQ